MNKIVFYFIVIIMLAGCLGSENTWNEEENVGYIDYSRLPVDRLTWEDKILLENMDFHGGKYVCALSREEVLAKGVDEKRYRYFLEYLEDQNIIIAEYIKDGATVTFGNKSFGLEGEFIEEMSPEFGESINLLSRASSGYEAAKGNVILGSKSVFCFSAYNQLGISGVGKEVSHWTVHLREPYRGLRKILSGTSSPTTVYIQTASSDIFVDWEWECECEFVNSYAASSTLRNIRCVELTFYTSKEWHYSATFNPVLPDYVSVHFNRNVLSVEIKDQNPEGINWLYYAEIYDNLSGILWYGAEIQCAHSIDNLALQGDRAITVYLSHARYDSELGKYVADQSIARQEFYVPKGW